MKEICPLFCRWIGKCFVVSIYSWRHLLIQALKGHNMEIKTVNEIWPGLFSPSFTCASSLGIKISFPNCLLLLCMFCRGRIAWLSLRSRDHSSIDLFRCCCFPIVKVLSPYQKKKYKRKKKHEQIATGFFVIIFWLKVKVQLPVMNSTSIYFDLKIIGNVLLLFFLVDFVIVSPT